MSDEATSELIADCLARIGKGDPNAAFDLASIVMGHAHEKEAPLVAATVEALVLLSRDAGSLTAGDFLTGQWHDMRQILERRLRQNGFT